MSAVSVDNNQTFLVATQTSNSNRTTMSPC